mmetsp:Transcript_45546/g.74490  ORF Transcript_45546/g.74490 Transcript_45546/m.74490 type:complete len:166 (-) Transcript_45546:132-629(-)
MLSGQDMFHTKMMKHRDRGDEVLMCNEDMLAQQKVLWKYDGDMCIAADGGEKIQQYAREEKKDGWMATPSLHHSQRSLLPAVRFGAQQKPEEEIASEERKESCNGPGSGVEASSSPPSQLSLPPRQRVVPWQQGNLGTETPLSKYNCLGCSRRNTEGTVKRRILV